MNLRPNIATALSALLLFAIPAAAARTDVADGEREFVQQLSDRGLFELAEQFCLRQFSSLKNPDERAEWELILSECQQQHAWHMDEDSRMGMIHQSVQRITEFLKSSGPTAAYDIRLRVRQLELIVSAGRMEAIVQSPLSQLSPDAMTENKDRSGRNRLPGRSTPPATQRVLDAIQQAETSSHSLLSQIDEIRKEIDNDVAKLARERIRMALAELAFAKAKLSPLAERSGLIKKAAEMAEPLVKSVTEDELRFRIRMLMAETLLAQNDFAAFKLRYGNLTSMATTPDEKASVAAIRIRGLLQQDQPSEALQEFVNASQNDLTMSQELQVLRLQSLLQLMELLSQLDASQQRTNLEQKTVGEFQQLKEKTAGLTSGAWRQRCVRLIEHFERVVQVGPEAAYSLESAAVLVDSGDLKGARAVLQSLLSVTTNHQPRNAAAILMQSGHLAIRLQDWKAATGDIDRAKVLYNKEQDRAGAAAADLLRVYVMGQQWNLDPAAGITEEIYEAALSEHLKLFGDQPTVLQAREWRARLLSNSDPIKAAEELLDLAQELEIPNHAAMDVTHKATSHLNLLNLAGDLLLEAVAVHAMDGTESSAEKVGRWKSVREKLAAEDNRVQADQSKYGEYQTALLQAQQSGLILYERLGSDTNWKTIDTEARDNLVAFTPTLPEGLEDTTPNASVKLTSADLEKAAAHAKQACHGMIVLSSIRQLTDLTQYEQSRSALLSLSITERLHAARLLMRQLPSEEPSMPGDGPLARFLIELVHFPQTPLESAPISVDLRLQQLRLLQPLSRAAGTRAAFDRSLDELLQSNLSDMQLTLLMEIINQPSAFGASKSESQAATSRRFWKTLYQRSKPGDDRWLEASLQLAILAEADGHKKESVKILGVVSVLHPEWGTPVRKAKAEELRKRLEKAP